MRRFLPVLLLAAAALNAQEYRATLLGAVIDPSGAKIPDASVVATNMETGVAAKSKANQDGNFVIPFLSPGRYSLRVEHGGFKTFERSPIELRVNDRTRVDVTLEIGQVTDRVTVTAEAPLLEMSTSNQGQVIENRKITDLPLNGRNPFVLANLAVGVVYTGPMKFTRPFGEGSAFTINGGLARMNEFQIDGVSNNLSTGEGSYNVAYVPPVEATQEFKVQTNTYDAQYGHTGGGVVSVSVKPGTNTLHGAVYEYLRRTPLEANQFSNNANGQPRADHYVDQYGFEIDGPVTLPKLYRGKDRTFFMFAMERYRESVPQPQQGSVPTVEQRKGDFSATRTASGQLYTIYDPLTIRPNPNFVASKAVSLSNLQYLRTPFAGNIVPQDRMEPIAQRVIQDIPMPTQDGHPVTAANNFFNGKTSEDNHFQNFIARVDHTISTAWKAYGRWSHSYRDEKKTPGPTGWDTAAAPRRHAGRQSDGAVVDAVGTISPSTIFSGRIGFQRYTTLSLYTPQDITQLGLPKSLASQLQVPDKYPQITWEGYMSAGDNDANVTPSETFTTQGTLMKMMGSHSLKSGVEFRLMRWAQLNRNNGAGTYGFTRSWTNSNPQVTDPAAGNAFASFLLGYMNSASAAINANPYQSWRYPVVFVQDDWQVSRRLTLNLGLRWDAEGAPTERFDRQNRGFDPNVKSPYQVAGLDLRGGLLFAGVDGQPRTAYNTDRDNWQPRVGLAYKPFDSKPMVFRAGLARNFLPTSGISGGTTGYTQSTSAQTSTPDFKPFRVLSNPFPNGLISPPGATGGFSTQVGDSLSFRNPDIKTPGVWQFSAGFQYELSSSLLVDASYVGSRTSDIGVDKSLSYLTLEQLALGTPYLSQTVPNPFYGVLPATTSRGAQPTIQRRGLMTQYPHFTGLSVNDLSLGRTWYNAFQLRLQKRMKHGLSFLVSYTNSKTMETVAYRNAVDTDLSRDLTATDIPQRLVVSGVYEFPFGKSKRWANSGLIAKLAGGWQYNWTVLCQSGPPMTYPNYFINGNPKLESGQNLNRWFDTSKEIWIQRPADTLRVTPFLSPNIRRHTQPQTDMTLIRDFHVREGHRVQFKVSAFNVTNSPIFNFPNTTPTSNLFGVVPVTQLNLPRSVEIAIRYVF